MFQNLWGNSLVGVMRGAGGCGASRLATAKRRLLQAAAVGALTLPGAFTSPDVASAQVATTLPEVTVTAPRPPPVRRAARAVAPSRAGRSVRVSAPTPSPAPAAEISAFQAVATTPITGLGVDRDKVPAMVQTLPAEDFSRVYSPNVVETLMQRIPGVSTNDVQGNEFAPDLRYRGFSASPVQGTPQGLAVYMQGVRVNEAFGDTVNWDLIPTIAIGRADVWTNNPAFGLNALGGAISFQMKDGFTYRGTEFRRLGRLLWARRWLAAIWHQEWGMGALYRQPGTQRRRLALPVAVAHRPLLRRSRVERHRCRGPSGRQRRRQFLRRDRADADRTAQ